MYADHHVEVAKGPALSLRLCRDGVKLTIRFQHFQDSLVVGLAERCVHDDEVIDLPDGSRFAR
jgi:hypothetical protein